MKYAVRSSFVDTGNGVAQPESGFEAHALSAAPSPARLLQERIHASFADDPATGKWPIAVRSGFILLSAASLWVVPIALVGLIRHYVA